MGLATCPPEACVLVFFWRPEAWDLVCVRGAGFCTDLLFSTPFHVAGVFCLRPFVRYSMSVLHIVVLVVCVSVCLRSYCGSLCLALFSHVVYDCCVSGHLRVCESLNSCLLFE